MDKAPDTLQPCSVDSLVDLLPYITSSSCGNEYDNHTKCGPQGWAVARVGFSRCLILFCKKLIVIPDMFDEKMVGTNFCKRLSFSLRIYKATSKSLKGNLYIEYEVSLVQAVGSFADVVPGLFRPVFEFVNSNVAIEGSFGTPILLLLEDFLELIWGTFCNNSVLRDSCNIDRFCLSWDDICSTMSLSSILGFWKSKQDVVVEDLVIERYIFVLCWDFPTIGTAKDHQLPLGSYPQTLGTSEIANIFYFSHSIRGHRGVDVKDNFLEVIVRPLHVSNCSYLDETSNRNAM
ncbi:hypothetical protein GBA52_011571 [Prunus armeniaca]|nr:hypothetical protein GBA52_011571 [Prunus armeniaca]